MEVQYPKSSKYCLRYGKSSLGVQQEIVCLLMVFGSTPAPGCQSLRMSGCEIVTNLAFFASIYVYVTPENITPSPASTGQYTTCSGQAT